MDLDNNAHSVFLLHHHLVFVVKYRRRVFNDDISKRAREIFEYIAPDYHITLDEWNHDEDHVHILFRAHPNSAISKFINAYKSASSRLLKKEFPEIRQKLWKECFWSQSFCLLMAFQNFFNQPGTGFPKFKVKKAGKDRYTTVCVNGNINVQGGCIKLPKLGQVKLEQHRSIPDNYILKSVTVSRTSGGQYYASILFEYEANVPEAEPQRFLGLDYSMHELYIDSNGNEAEYPRYYRQAEEKLKREQRKLSHMEKGSNNRNKQRIRLARLHEKVRNQRKDFLHKKSRQIANAYDCICIEDLDMRAMAKSLNFGKSVSDNGWGMFVTFLKYKLEDQGKKLVKVDKFFASSQICSHCGYVNRETRDLSVREWDCPQCGSHHDRDVNAAINIRNEGMRIALA